MSFRDIINKSEELITGFLFFMMGVFIFLQLFSRFILKSPLIFTEEIARYSYVWITFIGMSLATKTGDHIKVDFFIKLLPSKRQFFLERITNIINAILFLYLGYLGIRFSLFSWSNVSAALHIPLYFVYGSFPLGCFLAALRTLQTTFSSGAN